MLYIKIWINGFSIINEYYAVGYALCFLPSYCCPTNCKVFLDIFLVFGFLLLITHHYGMVESAKCNLLTEKFQEISSPFTIDAKKCCQIKATT